ncbi:unnamed protein product [Symbiodinium sp. CCMP2592]|nr:unnamed protein product [Symbiodinium sp. CCMP2592]
MHSKLLIANLAVQWCCGDVARSVFHACDRESWVHSGSLPAVPSKLFIANLGYTRCYGQPAHSAFQAFHRESWVQSALRAACPLCLPSFSSRILGAACSLPEVPSKLFIANLGRCGQPARSAFQAFHRESWVHLVLRANLGYPQSAGSLPAVPSKLFIANLGYIRCCGHAARSAFQAVHRESWVHWVLRAACPQCLRSFSSRILATVGAAGSLPAVPSKLFIADLGYTRCCGQSAPKSCLFANLGYTLGAAGSLPEVPSKHFIPNGYTRCCSAVQAFHREAWVQFVPWAGCPQCFPSFSSQILGTHGAAGSLPAVPSKLFIANLGYTRCAQPARSAFQAFHRETSRTLGAAGNLPTVPSQLFIANLGHTPCCGHPASSAFQAFHRESWVHSVLRAACPQCLSSFSSRILGSLGAAGSLPAQEEASSSQAPQGAKGSGAAEAPARPRRPLIGERTEAPNQSRGRPAEPEKGKGKTGPSAGRPASESGSRTPRRGEKGAAGKPTKGKPAKGAAQPAKGKAAQAEGAEQPAKGKPAPAGKSSKGKPAAQEPAQGSGKKKNHRGGRSQAARANREARGAERREREGTDPVVLVEGPGTDIPEPRTPEQTPAGAGQEVQSPSSSESSLDTAPVRVPVFTGPAPGEDTPDFGGSDSEGEREAPPAAAAASSSSGAVPAKKEEPAARVAPPASAEAAVEPAEEAKPEASPKAALKKRRSGSEGPNGKGAAALAWATASASGGTQGRTARASSAVPPAPREEAPEEEQEPTSPASGEEEGEESEESSEGQGPCQFLNGLRHAARNRPRAPWEGNPELAEQYGEALTLLDEIRMSQQPAYPPPQGDPVVEALRGEVATLRGLLESQAQQLQAAIGELPAQRQQGLAAAAATAAVATAAPAPASQASGGGHLLKSMQLPTSLKGRDDWERFAFQAETYLAVVDTRYPAELEVARKCKVPLQMATMTEEVRTLSVRLFGMLGSWTQDSATAVKLARGVKGQNGFELWRLLWQEHNPENESKNLTWRRTLLMPKFPPKESDFSLALQEWEADVDRYASEYGAGRALADEDLRAVLVTESPNALRQHLAMHAASLSTYAEVREVVVSYLQAKRGTETEKKGRAKATKARKGTRTTKRADHDHKGKKGDKKGNQHGGRDGKERCPICWKTGHTVKECWFNAKGKGKGNKGQVAQVADDAATTLSTASLATAGPSASQAGGSTGGSGGKGQVRQVRDDRILGVRFAPPHDTEPEEDKILKVSGSLLVDSGACVSVCRPEAFPDLQPAGPPKSLYSVDNSRLKTKGRVQPSLLLGEERQSCKVNFEAGAGIWLHREDSHILWPDGVRASILKRGSQFLLPYERELPPGSTNRVAPVAAEPPSPGKDLGHYDYIPEQKQQPTKRPKLLKRRRLRERAEHELTHTPYQAWCEPSDDPVTPLVTMDYQFYSRDGKEVEEEASLATVLNLTDRATGWTLSVPVAHKGRRHAAYVVGLVEQLVDCLGYDKFTLQADQENAIASVARAVHRRLGAARVRTWLSQLRADYPALEWDTSSNLLGVWAGKLERDDSHVVLTEAAHSTRQPFSKRAACLGTPDLAAQRQQRSEPMMVPIPLATPAEEVERLEPPGEPWLFSDGPRPDDEALLVEGAEQASRLPDASPTEELANAAIPDYEPSDVEAAPSAASALPQHIAALADPPLTNRKVEQARKEQLRKLWDRGAFTPVLRCTCADVKARYSPEQDRGAAEGRPVYMHAPVEWRELFDQWVLEQPVKDQQWYRDHFREFVFRVDGNLYGRRTAGSVYRDELEEVLTGKLAKDYDFQRGVKDPCVYLDRRSGLILLHHIDDIRVAGPKAAVLKFTEVDLPTHCEITVGELEEPGTAVEVLGRTKVRTEDSILTLPGTVHSRPLDLTKVEELSAGDAARFRSAVGSAIYLSADRRDIQFAVKELARRMQNPRVCDWLAAETLARYLRATPRFGRVVVLDPASKSTALLNLEVYSDSDWAGCPETRRSTDNIVACLRGAVIQTSCQTQHGLPATSSGDAEIRGVSRAAREAVFLRELAEKDFALACGLPRLWADSAASIGAAKRIGPGSKLRHLEVAEFYVQGALRAKLLELRKVKGTENPANFATKHAKTGPEVRQSLPSIGMVDLDAVAGATEALAQKGTIKAIQASPWKMRPPTKLASSALMATIVALQVRPAKAQGHDFAELVLGFAALGFLAFLWMLWGLVSWLCRCRRDRQEPEPEDEIEHHAERAEEPPRAAQRATEIWLGQKKKPNQARWAAAQGGSRARA